MDSNSEQPSFDPEQEHNNWQIVMPPKVPARVEVAFDVFRWSNTIESISEKSYDGENSLNRELSNKEKVVYESALEVVRLYLNGEMTFSESPTSVSPVVDNSKKVTQNTEITS